MTTALTNLYVRNLPMEWTAADLIALGEKYGPVVSAKVLYNPLTTASRGMGFIRFAEHADATLAIAGMNGHIPDSAVHAKPLNVQFAKDQQVGGSSSSRGGDGTRYSPYPTAKRAAGSATDSSGAAVGFVESLPVAPDGTDPLNVYVVDLPFTFTKEEFHALYEPFGCLVTSTVLTDPNSGQSRGIGFARYSNKDNAARALKETQGMMLPGASKPLLVRFARDSSRKHEEQTNSTLQRLHTPQHQQPPPPPQQQQPMHPQHPAYTSTYSQHYPYAPAYTSPPLYYPHYAPPLTSPAHRAALPTPPPPPMPQPPAPASAASPAPSAARANSNHSAAPNAAPSAAAADSSSAASAAAYQQAWAAYYAQLGYPGYYTGYQYPATAYPAAAPYSYPAHTAPSTASPTASAPPAAAAAAVATAAPAQPPASSSPPSSLSAASASASSSVPPSVNGTPSEGAAGTTTDVGGLLAVPTASSSLPSSSSVNG